MSRRVVPGQVWSPGPGRGPLLIVEVGKKQAKVWQPNYKRHAYRDLSEFDTLPMRLIRDVEA